MIEEDIINDIFDNILDVNYETYLHTTNYDAFKLIIKFGLLIPFYERNTLDLVTKKSFTYRCSYRKNYGDYCLILQFPYRLLDIDDDDVDNREIISKTIDKINSENPNILDDVDTEFNYLIPPKYIIGYIYKEKFIKL